MLRSGKVFGFTEEASSAFPDEIRRRRYRRLGSKKSTTEILPLKRKGRSVAGKKKAAVVDNKYITEGRVDKYMYDWITNHKLMWPSVSCRWGPPLADSKFVSSHRLYLSEEETNGRFPNTLVIANCGIVKQGFAALEYISPFNEGGFSRLVKKYKTILHPGKVNRIKELPQNKHIIATRTDRSEVLIWDVERQPNLEANPVAGASCPDLVLTRDTDNAGSALAMCSTEPYVLSGGKDKKVVLWSINDNVSTLSGSYNIVYSNAVQPRGIFQGHTDTVNDVQFCPTSKQQFCSVGDDSCMIFWDERSGTKPVMKVEKAHNDAVYCVDWNPHNDCLILTGSADRSVRMFDRRSVTSNGVGSPVHKVEKHKAPVLCVQWCPNDPSVFGSSAEDINIWRQDHEEVAQLGTQKLASRLFFKHRVHRGKVVDFHWNLCEPWTIVSLSNDVETRTGDAGTLQFWRMEKNEVL